MFCFPPRLTQPDQSSPTTDVCSQTFLSFFCLSRLHHALFTPSVRILTKRAVPLTRSHSEFSQLLNNVNISRTVSVQSLQIRIPGRSHAQCWFSFALHNSPPNTLISFKQLRSSLLTNCSKIFTTFSFPCRAAPGYFYCFSPTTSLLITSAERSSQT